MRKTTSTLICSNEVFSFHCPNKQWRYGGEGCGVSMGVADGENIIQLKSLLYFFSLLLAPFVTRPQLQAIKSTVLFSRSGSGGRRDDLYIYIINIFIPIYPLNLPINSAVKPTDNYPRNAYTHILHTSKYKLSRSV